jgi:hypothetical protein
VAKFSPPDTTAPVSEAKTPLCRGAVTVTVRDNLEADDPEGSGPRAVHLRLDGGTEQSVKTEGNPGMASIAIPEGNHTLEYWGEDAAGNLEIPHHVASVRIDTTPPAVSITSDQGFSSYEIGDRASFTIIARDATSGLVSNPSTKPPEILRRAGHFIAGLNAPVTDRCGNSAAASFPYTVIPDPVLARSVNLESRGGRVTVKLPGGAAAARAGASAARGLVALVGARQVPVGTIVDASGGTVAVTAATAGPRHLQTGTFQGGRFVVLQPRGKRGLVELRLIDAASRRVCTTGRTARELASLRSSADGRFRTSGRYSSATTHSSPAAWSIDDRCNGTLTRVARGSLTVRNFRTARHKIVRAGHRYLARSRGR